MIGFIKSMLGFLLTVRRKLRLISYHSATRERSIWSTILARALFITLVLAVPATLVGESLFARPVTVESIGGALIGERPGPITAIVNGGEGGRGAWPGEYPYGEWTLTVADVRWGFPVPTTTRRQPPRLDVNDYARQGVDIGVRLEPGDPVRVAIEDALDTPAHRRWRAAWIGAGTTAWGAESTRYWRGTFLGIGIWWLTLMGMCLVLVAIAWALTHASLGQRFDRHAARVAQGRCGHCGYDLRGLEFHDRCPECGGLQE